ncbi:MAG TPA: hypothetical protein DIS90_05695 [Cytophagales bacterium]|nr:hypothetical protein [Cytophagales bacterium]HCR54691.1 hypothetical protein [Cytophagales bacterium]
MKLYIDRRALFGFIVALFIFLWLGYFSYRNNQQFLAAREAIFHTTEVLIHIEQTQNNAVKVEELIAKYIISQDNTYLTLYNHELEKAAEHYNKLVALTADNESQQVKLDSFVVAGTKKLSLHQKIVEAMKNSTRREAADILSSEENMKSTQKVNSILTSIRTEENSLLLNRVAKSKAEMKAFETTFMVLMVTTMLILLAVFVIINNSFRSRLMAEERAHQINSELESFTYSVSHDLRAPLRSIRGFAEVLKEEYGPSMDQESNRLLGIIMRNASRMGQLIDDLLDFSRLGRKQLSYSKIETRGLVTEIIGELTVHDSRNVKWEIQPLEHTVGDLSMIRQVWVNLISNALKYTRNNPEATIQIGNYSHKGNMVYFVKDNGVGFDMKYSDKLFKVFQRLHNNQEFEGTGVGLALVQRIITKHKGKIWAEAEVNQGASFFFYLSNPTI